MCPGVHPWRKPSLSQQTLIKSPSLSRSLHVEAVAGGDRAYETSEAHVGMSAGVVSTALCQQAYCWDHIGSASCHD